MTARRLAALDRFNASGLPTVHDEPWKYSPIAELDLDKFEPLDPGSVASDVPAPVATVLEAIGDRSGLVVVRDGRVAHVEVDAGLAARGLRIGNLFEIEPDERDGVGMVPGPSDALTDLHDALVIDVVLVSIPDGMVVPSPIVVVQWIDADRSMVFPHVTVRAGTSSEVKVVHYEASAEVDSFADSVIELDVGPAANMSYVGVQDWAPTIWQTAQLLSRTDRDATLRSLVVSLGGSYARLFIDATLPGQGSTTQIEGVYFGSGEQVHDFRSVQDHLSQRGTSNFLLKGAVADKSRGIYSGVITVREGARGTDAFLTNRNLVLSDGAGVDSIPNLEIISENDLKNCGHAAATGPVDDEHLFYLESRGIPTDVAERLIVFGFFDEVVAKVPMPGLRELLRQAVAVKLAGGAA